MTQLQTAAPLIPAAATGSLSSFPMQAKPEQFKDEWCCVRNEPQIDKDLSSHLVRCVMSDGASLLCPGWEAAETLAAGLGPGLACIPARWLRALTNDLRHFALSSGVLLSSGRLASCSSPEAVWQEDFFSPTMPLQVQPLIDCLLLSLRHDAPVLALPCDSTSWSR